MRRLRMLTGTSRLLILSAMSFALATIPNSRPVTAADDVASKPDPVFANEPKRPKAESPIRFTESWDEARAEAKRSGRRLLAYFTNDTCGWCRALEKRTFTDAEVVALSDSFVCVELNTEKHPTLTDGFRIDSIPRSIVLDTEGREVDRRSGYVPAAEYAAWLEAARTLPPRPVEGPVSDVPPPAGDPEPRADTTIWFVDSTRSIKRWGDDDWTGHAHLLRLLRAVGLRPRVEHIPLEGFPARWEHAVAMGKTPELITADQKQGLVGALLKDGRLVAVESQRLIWTTEIASCSDFAKRFIFLVAESKNEATGLRAVAELLRPGPRTSLPGVDLPEGERRADACAVAGRACEAYFSGDREGVSATASASSPQLARCTDPPEFRRGNEVSVDSVEVRGNGVVAFARVEMRLRSKNRIWADPVLVVLRREGLHWKAFAVTEDVLSVKELPALCRLELRSLARPTGPPTPQLLSPPNGGTLEDVGSSFAWDIPAGGDPLGLQVCQVLLDEKGSKWPRTLIEVYPGEPRGRSLLRSETDGNVTGLSAAKMGWCVWAIGKDGSINSSEVRSYQVRGFQY